MIKIVDWRSSRCDKLLEDSKGSEYSIAFTSSHPIDDRTGWASKYISEAALEIKYTSFDYTKAILKIDGEKVPINSLHSYPLNTESRILVDATSLAFPEILYIFMLLNINKLGFDVLYAQPVDYAIEKKDESGDRRPIRLSEDGIGPKQLPPYVKPTRKSSMLIFLGFEGHRLGGISNSDSFGIPEHSYLLGIPGFKSGWENKAILNNIPYIQETGTPRFLVASANDPLYTYDIIEEQYKVAKYRNKIFFIAPFGTKPAGIAAANFAVNNPSNLSVVYDFIQNRVGRSNGSDIAHKWRFEYVDC